MFILNKKKLLSGLCAMAFALPAAMAQAQSSVNSETDFKLSPEELAEIAKSATADETHYDNKSSSDLTTAVGREYDLQKAKELLAGKKADPDFKDGAPLATAADYGHLDAIKLLVEAGAYIHFGDGGTLLMHAADSGNKDIVLFLIDQKINLFTEDIELFLQHIQIARYDPDYPELYSQCQADGSVSKLCRYFSPAMQEIVGIINDARKAQRPDYVPKDYVHDLDKVKWSGVPNLIPKI